VAGAVGGGVGALGAMALDSGRGADSDAPLVRSSHSRLPVMPATLPRRLSRMLEADFVQSSVLDQ